KPRRGSRSNSRLPFQIECRERPRPIAWDIVVVLKMSDGVVGFFGRGPESIEDFHPMRNAVAGLFDHLLVTDVPVIRFHDSTGARNPLSGLGDVQSPPNIARFGEIWRRSRIKKIRKIPARKSHAWWRRLSRSPMILALFDSSGAHRAPAVRAD